MKEKVYFRPKGNETNTHTHTRVITVSEVGMEGKYTHCQEEQVIFNRHLLTLVQLHSVKK